MFKMKKILSLLLMLILIAQPCLTYAKDKEYQLSLKEVTDLALQNNFSIQMAKYDALISRTDKLGAQSIYDSVLKADANYKENKKVRTSTAVSDHTIENNYNLELSKKIPTGTTVTVDMDNARSWGRTSSLKLNPMHQSTLGVTLKQELGKNFLGIEDRGDVKITLFDISNTEYTSLDTIETEVAAVQKAYWNLALAYELKNIQESVVEQAKRLYNSHQEKLKDGLSELPDVIASEANYLERINQLLLDENNIAAKENVLKLQLNIAEDTAKILPKEKIEIAPYKSSLQGSLKEAFNNRRDYKRYSNEISSKNIKVSVKKSNLWPEINLTASLAQNGIGDHFSQSAKNLDSDDNQEIFAGVSISFALENKEARSQLSAAKLEQAKALVQMKLIERQIILGIHDQVRECNILKTSAQNKQKIADLQQKKLEEEEKRFNQGRSNIDTIIRYQDDLLRSRVTSALANYAYLASLIDLRQKEGVLLNQLIDQNAFIK